MQTDKGHAVMIVKENWIKFAIRTADGQTFTGAEPFSWQTYESAKHFVHKLAWDKGVKSIELLEDYE